MAGRHLKGIERGKAPFVNKCEAQAKSKCKSAAPDEKLAGAAKVKERIQEIGPGTQIAPPSSLVAWTLSSR